MTGVIGEWKKVTTDDDVEGEDDDWGERERIDTTDGGEQLLTLQVHSIPAPQDPQSYDEEQAMSSAQRRWRQDSKG